MIQTLHRSVLALLLIAAVGSLCVASCFASVAPGKADAHACCPKNKKSAPQQSAKPARDCDGQPAEAAAQLLHIATPEFTGDTPVLPVPVAAARPEPVLLASASPPDILTLQHILLI